ncbi:16 kDa beta-galactoside-binding lectin-like isoform X1 [Hemicordylus capensis]|uniref:16 kDa beta-galactoside-binding lectin-like isoform X1 n=1 Tax=Hemicordylus capensis TaxID=884348 RepID=UPI002303CDBF|nr:16 kDa beta-galactoside-binding lectin-like isoform X1 [Hemicordylus capensis]
MAVAVPASPLLGAEVGEQSRLLTTCCLGHHLLLLHHPHGVAQQEAGAQRFVVDLGKDQDNLVLRFNPHFNSLGDMNTIVWNSKQDGIWGEKQEAEIAFHPGDKIKVCFTFGTSGVQVNMFPLEMVQVAESYLMRLKKQGIDAKYDRLLRDVELIFPNRLGLKAIEYLSVQGSIKIGGLKFTLVCG